MMTDLIKEPDGSVADFHVKLPSDGEPQPTGEPGKSLVREVELLRQQLAQLCQAVRGLVTLISVLDKKVDAALRSGADKVGCM